MKTRFNLRTSSTAFLSVVFFAVLFVIITLSAGFTLQLNTHEIPSVLKKDPQALSQNILQQHGKEIAFIENLGQIKDTDGEERPDVLFLTRADGVDMYLTNTGMTYVFRNYENDTENLMRNKSFYRLDMEFVGINKDIVIKKEQSLAQQFHYYTPEYPDGLSPKAFKKITIEDLYEGIDLIYYEKDGRMKYDFRIHSGADPDQIKMKYTGASSMEIDEIGNVIITTPMGVIQEEKPFTYSGSTGLSIKSKYQVEENTVLFDVAEYGKNEDIIIDPVRVWASYYGGSMGEKAESICTDESGNIYITGRSYSTDFPTLTLAGAFNQSTYGGGTPDAFILKFNSSGERLWATYYGGNDIDEGNSICTDNLNNIYVAGETQSVDFPIQTMTGAFNQTTLADTLDVFILKFDSNGVRQWATYYGGTGLDRGFDVCTDSSNNLYVSGETGSTDFPTQTFAGAYNQTTYGGGARDGFILKFDSNGARLWATYYGGSNFEGRDGSFWQYTGGMCTDNSDNVYVTGATNSADFPVQSLPGAYNQNTLVGSYTDVFILKFNSGGERLWATYYGGSIWDVGCDIVTDGAGALYVTGQTYSYNDFPTFSLPGAYNQTFAGGSEAFILKFDNAGARQWATCYGGITTNNERGNGIALDNEGNLYIVGNAQQGSFNSEFPTQILPGAYNQTTHGGGANDAFIIMFKNSGERQWATFYGGSGGESARDCSVDNDGNFYVTGGTSSGDFPVQNFSGAFNQNSLGGTDGNNDAYILRFDAKYCNSGGLNFDHVYISDITAGDLSNTSGGSYYSDFTALTMSGTHGTSYPVSLSFWKDHGSLKADWRVWIDLNIDGDFDDAEELVFSADNKSGSANGTITIPSNTSVGLSRMRISMRDGSGDFGPCDVHNSGEVEDYAIDLQPAVALPPVSDFEGTPTTVTVGNSVDFSDLSLNDPTSWDWSFEGGTPVNSTDQNPTVTYYTEGTYEVSLTATNAEGSDTETKLSYITVVSGGCATESNVFPEDPLTHTGPGFSSTTYDFGAPGHSNISFVVSDLGAKTKGNANSRYIDLVTISYTDNIGSQTYGIFSGENTNTVNVDMAGPVYSVTITLEDGYDGVPPGTISVDPGTISSCPPAGALPITYNSNEKSSVMNISELSAYPNPTTDILTIRYEVKKTSDGEVTLTDISGQKLYNLIVHQIKGVQSHKIDVSKMPAGIYFLQVRSEGIVKSKRIIIVR